MKNAEEIEAIMIAAFQAEINIVSLKILECAKKGHDSYIHYVGGKLKPGTLRHFEKNGFEILQGENCDLIKW